MNRKNLTAAVLAGLAGAAGIAGSAQAVNINPDGLGQVLIYPYYTTNGGNSTLLSVVNTTDQAKAVKVRFLEGENSQEVLDFNLYMSAYDVWTAAVVPIPAGTEDTDCDDPNDADVTFCAGPQLIVMPDETTCTVPTIAPSQAFLPFQYSADLGSQDQSRGNEGHFEMIEMGTLTDEGFDPEAAATHDHSASGDGTPDCATLVAAWTDPDNTVVGDEGAWLLNEAEGIGDPTGGLFGGASIINVQAGAMYSYDATAINGWSETGRDAFDLSNHTEPGRTEPSLNSGDSMEGFVFTDDGQLKSSGVLARSVDAVSYVFMHDAVMNEYTTQSSVAAATEWVLTFPTKKFYVDPQVGDDPLAPFTHFWEPETEGALATACETVSLKTLWDREERVPATPDDPLGDPVPPRVSPKPPGVTPPPPVGIAPFQLCYETNVIRFGAAGDDDELLPAATEVLGSPFPMYRNIDNVTEGFDYGWARIELDDYVEDVNQNGKFDADEAFSRDPIDGLEGLPVVGFAVEKFSNGFLGDNQDVLSAYGGLFSHKSTRKLSSLGSAG